MLRERGQRLNSDKKNREIEIRTDKKRHTKFMELISSSPVVICLDKIRSTRTHSSRMRTVRRLGRGGGVCIGGICLRGMSAKEGVCLGVSTQGGVSPGAVCLGGCLPKGCTPPMDPEADIIPVNRMTDRGKNITLPQTSFVSGKNHAFLRKKQNIWATVELKIRISSLFRLISIPPARAPNQHN